MRALNPERDDNLEAFATPRQWEILEAMWAAGSQIDAATKLGLRRGTISSTLAAVRRKAARRGYSPSHDMTRPVPDGFVLRGASTYYGRDGTVRGQWVKSAIDAERQLAMMQEAAAGLAESLPRVAPVAPPAAVLGSLMAVYPVSDHHLGLYAWGEEVGADYDIASAEVLLSGAMASLAGSVPPAALALIAILGDLFHYDGLEPLTPTSKNLLDSDGRYAKMIRVGLRVVRRVIDLALARHGAVRVIAEPGNHDLSTAVFLAECLAALYEQEPRVTVDTSPRHFHYHEFGRNLLGVHHGHGVKLKDLPLIMAADQPEAWGRTAHRWWLTGHIHHESVHDIQGVRVESFRVLPPADAHAYNKGYRSARQMSAVVLHAQHGEVARYTVNPEMLEAA